MVEGNSTGRHFSALGGSIEILSKMQLVSETDESIQSEIEAEMDDFVDDNSIINLLTKPPPLSPVKKKGQEIYERWTHQIENSYAEISRCQRIIEEAECKVKAINKAYDEIIPNLEDFKNIKNLKLTTEEEQAVLKKWEEEPILQAKFTTKTILSHALGRKKVQARQTCFSNLAKELTETRMMSAIENIRMTHQM